MNFNETIKKIKELDIEKESLCAKCSFEYPLPQSHSFDINISLKKLYAGYSGKQVLDFRVIRYFQCIPGGSEEISIGDLDTSAVKKVLKIKKEMEDWAEGNRENPPKGYRTLEDTLRSVSANTKKFRKEIDELTKY